MFKKTVIIASILASTAFSGTTLATVIDDHGNYLTDKTAGLDWLDVTASFGKSYAYVSSQFGTAGLYAGWRYATGDEFNTLISNYTGVNIAGYGVTDQETDLIDGLVTLLGNYNPTTDVYYLAGFISDTAQASSNQYLAGICDNDNPNAQCMLGARNQDVSVAHLTDVSPAFSQGNIGSFLVRTAINNVPEPTSNSLIGLGIAAIAFWRRKPKLT